MSESSTPNLSQTPQQDSKQPSRTSSTASLTLMPSSEANELEPTFIFKNPNFVHSARGGSISNKKVKTWKSLKQIIAAEKLTGAESQVPTYGTIDAVPSLKPCKKYSDLSGLPGKYRDPQTKLMYYSSMEFNHIRTLPSDIVNGYLALRKADVPIP